MPASRSARAMIFAPRSCPSSPGFAISTRIFLSVIGVARILQFAPFCVPQNDCHVRKKLCRSTTCPWHDAGSNSKDARALRDGDFFVDAEDISQRVAYFTERRVSFHGVVNMRHQIFLTLRRLAKSFQAAVNFRAG